MALHRSQDRLLPIWNGNVLTDGGSLNLAKGQLGVFNVESVTKDGLDALSATDIAALKDYNQIQIRVGKSENPITRSSGNKGEFSRTFRIKDVESLKVFAPSLKKKVDEIIIGYNGTDGTEITLEKGDNIRIDISLSGRALGIMGYEDACFDFSVYLTKTEDDTTNQEIVEKAVEDIKQTLLHSGVPVTEFIEVVPVNSENPASVANAVESTYYHLDVNDNGDSNALANVQAQYDFPIKRTDRVGVTSTYTSLQPTIASDGVPTAYKQPKGVKIVGCDSCPTGYTADSENDSICVANSATTVAWTAGDSCNATTVDYTLTLPDDDCGNNRLTEVQDYYDDTTITAGTSTACQTTYTKSVTTNIVCEDCDEVFRDLFTSEPPTPFGVHKWKKADKTYSDAAKMGIKIKGKETISLPDEFLSDSVPFFNTSVHLSVSAGQYFDASYSYDGGKHDVEVTILQRGSDLQNLGGDLWPLEDRDYTYFNGVPDYIGDKDSVQSQFAKQLYGRESLIKPNSQYIVYSLKVSPTTRTQSFNKVLSEGFDYLIPVEVGKHSNVQTLLNAIATKAGVPTVTAYAD